jgi:outer membrane protein assembly factor BamB
LDHEIEAYNGTSGTLVAWVRVPYLSASADTQLYMFYGNQDCDDQWNPTGVWDDQFQMVHHLQETSGTHQDSTIHNNDGTPVGGVTQDATGIIDGADDFDGDNSMVNCGTGEEHWSNQDQGQQRAVIVDGKIYVVGGGDDALPTFHAYIFVFDLITGDLLLQSPSLGEYDFTASETAPVVDGDMVYAAPTFGNVWAWDMNTNSILWTTTGLSIWSNRLEYDGSYLYATTTDYTVVMIDTADGSVVHQFSLDPDTDYENAVPPYLDESEGVVFALGDGNLYKLSAADLSQQWSRPIGDGCLDTGGGHSRMAPIVVNDAYTGNEPWVIFGCWGNDIFYAYDYDGNQEWSTPIPEGVRAVASYNPNNGYLYIPSQGERIYVLDVADGLEQFSITDDDVPYGSGFGQPCTISNNYLIFKTTGGNPRYIYIFDATTGARITQHSLGDNLFLTCFPIAASQGYLVTGGSLINYGSQDGGIFAVRAGNGQTVDYYPLYGPARYGYIQDALTDLDLQNSLNPASEITLEAWANLEALTPDPYMNDHLLCRELTYCLKFAQWNAGDAPRFQLYGTTGGWRNLDLSDPLATGAWYYLAGTWDGTTMRFYINGNLEDTLGFTGNIDSNANPTLIGSYNTNPYLLEQAPDGRIDEIRLSDTARTGEWISTCYNNQNSPSTFYSLGGETPTAVKLVSFSATPEVQAVNLVWQTASEIDNLGFNLYRSDTADGEYARLNETLIPSKAPGQPGGATYTWLDENVEPGMVYYYHLEDIDIYGERTLHGPVWAAAKASQHIFVYLPVVRKP